MLTIISTLVLIVKEIMSGSQSTVNKWANRQHESDKLDGFGNQP